MVPASSRSTFSNAAVISLIGIRWVMSRSGCRSPLESRRISA